MLYSPMLLLRWIVGPRWCGPRSFKQQRITEWHLKKKHERDDKKQHRCPK
jgi:hypothetical protein